MLEKDKTVITRYTTETGLRVAFQEKNGIDDDKVTYKVLIEKRGFSSLRLPRRVRRADTSADNHR